LLRTIDSLAPSVRGLFGREPGAQGERAKLSLAAGGKAAGDATARTIYKYTHQTQF